MFFKKKDKGIVIEEATAKTVNEGDIILTLDTNHNEAATQVINITTVEPEEEWIWVEGIKGTDRNMSCRGYQFELGKQFDMPEDAEIKLCENGFHFSKTLSDVLHFYEINYGNRFFKVRGLVRKADYEKYQPFITVGWASMYSSYSGSEYAGKLVAKSIEFIEELTLEEIFKDTLGQNLPEKYQRQALVIGITMAWEIYRTDKLQSLGFSEPFARWCVKNKRYEKALAIGEMDVSMETKVWFIMTAEG